MVTTSCNVAPSPQTDVPAFRCGEIIGEQRRTAITLAERLLVRLALSRRLDPGSSLHVAQRTVQVENMRTASESRVMFCPAVSLVSQVDVLGRRPLSLLCRRDGQSCGERLYSMGFRSSKF